MMSPRAKWTLLGAGAAGVVALDQLTKAMVVSHFGGVQGRGQNVIPGFFDLVYTRNPGGAFSMLRNMQPEALRIGFFLLVTVIAIGVVISLTRRAESKWMVAALSLLLGGALGNMVDRLLVGTVCDFLLFYRGEWDFPAFNVADIAINLGVYVLLIDAFLGRKKKDAPVESRSQVLP